MWEWILLVLKRPLPDETSQAQNAALKLNNTVYGFLTKKQLRKSLASRCYVSQFNELILPTKVIMRTGKHAAKLCHLAALCLQLSTFSPAFHR